jgi:hypothetical protein
MHAVHSRYPFLTIMLAKTFDCSGQRDLFARIQETRI